MPINFNKLVPLTTVMTCMAIEVDAHDRTVKIPDTKLREIVDEIHHFGQQKCVTKQTLQSLLGK